MMGHNGPNFWPDQIQPQISTQDLAPEPIAIVGMALRLPGGIHSAEDFWELLLNKKDTRCKVPASRYNIDGFYSQFKTLGSVGMQYGHFLAEDDDLQHFDASFFNMSKTEIEKLDPQQKMLLEVVWECMENGGQKNWRGDDIGCFVGVWGEDWLDLAAKDAQDAGTYRISGQHDFAISNRISYEYDLKGPSMTLKTGCSSSLIGLHQACLAIHNGDCTSAIVAGTNLIMSPTMTIAMTEQGVLSADGKCKTFDESADGYARGEAINAVFIKPLNEAIRLNDPIRAIIRSTASNCDGKTPGMAMPSLESHASMIKRAYETAHIHEVSATTFVECHGTGTAVGDPLEVGAIASVFGGDKSTYIGSVKPNVGHSEGASGITSIIKTVLALENRIIPPNINFVTPNPKIPFKEANLIVPVEAVPWPQDCLERASVNSFGIGGANAHVVLDSASSFGIKSAVTTHGRPLPRPHLLALSANNKESLQKRLASVQQYNDCYPSTLPDLAYTLGSRREHLSSRSYCVTDGRTPMDFAIPCKFKAPPQIVFVFTGQGAHWAQMGKELMENYSVFDEDLRTLSHALAQLPDGPTWEISDELLKTGPASRLSEPDFAQPLCTAIQIALVNLLRDWGVAAEAVVGHSSGEIAAAYAAGAISAREAVVVAYLRGQAAKACTRRGGMAAIGLGRREVSQYLLEGVVLACENSPRSVTLSGDLEALENILAKIKADLPETTVSRLHVNTAYHSHHMKSVGLQYQISLESHIESKAPNIPFFSSVMATQLTSAGSFGQSYWRQNLESPVLFSSAIKACLEFGTQDQVYLEIGPHSALGGPLRQTFKAYAGKRDVSYVSTLRRGKDCTQSLLNTAGQLHVKGTKINFKVIEPAGNVLTDLPLYPWRHDTKYWSEGRGTREWRFRKFVHHEILGSRTLESSDLEPSWRNMLRLEDVPWLRDHVIINDIVFPCAGYIAMAGEAIRQLTGTDDFSLRHLTISTALVLQYSKVTELLTSLKPARLTTTLDSAWYDFWITSHDGNIWMKHCVGQVRAGRGVTASKVRQRFDKLPRKVPSPYTAMKRVGLNYGPMFQGLKDVSAMPGKNTAVATLSTRSVAGSRYCLHPTAVDCCLQLFTIAMSEGISRRLVKLCVPVSIKQLYIRGGVTIIDNMAAEAVAFGDSASVVTGNATVLMEGELLMFLQGGKFCPLENDTDHAASNTIAAARLEWRPDINFCPSETLIKPRPMARVAFQVIEKLAFLSIIEVHNRISGTNTPTEHMKKFKRWLDLQIIRLNAGQVSHFERAQHLLSLSTKKRATLITELREEAAESDAAVIAESINRIVDNCKDLAEGCVSGIEVLQADNALTNVYALLEHRTDAQEFYALCGHENPNLRVLEIGAGTGGSTAASLKGLTRPNGERMYSSYSYTDISAGFFPDAKDRFAEYQGMEFKVLDITKPPMEQGFEAESYDLIIAADVLHATPDLHATLLNVRKLLRRRGRLFLQELSPVAQCVNLIMGVLPGWWLGEADGRAMEPYINPDRWHAHLVAAGFSGADAVVYDDEAPYHFNHNIISRPALSAAQPQRVTLLWEPEKGAHLVDHVQQILNKIEIQVDRRSLRQSLPADQDIISLLDMQRPVFDSMSKQELEDFKALLRNLGSACVLWVTQPAQIGCEDPRYSIALGMARTIRLELDLAFATLELHPSNPFAPQAITGVFARFRTRDVDAGVDPEFEFALQNESIYIGRYHPADVSKDHWSASVEKLPRRLEIGKVGLLESLRWAEYSKFAPSSEDLVVEARCVGLNFKDVLISMGIVDDSGEGLGLEGSGVILETGSNVVDFSVGDRVMMMHKDCFSTRSVIPQKRCVKLPDCLSLEDAATMPCVYVTVIHSLLKAGALGKDQTILIHSACGGIGLAAIQIARMVGAKIFVTVSNDQKGRYLMDTFAIPQQCIFNSRDTSFLADVMRETENKGVDLVLNSLSGELLHTSWQCVAEFGRMVEIGKRDFIGQAKLSMDLFEMNRSFIGVDMARFPADKMQPLLAQVVELFEKGLIKPIRPIKVFDAAKVEDAFRYMQKGQHIGKVVVSMPENQAGLPLTPTAQVIQLRSDASYLLVGGLGGLGRAISTWMVEQGARHIVYISRSAGKSERDQEFFIELQSQGCSVHALAKSITDYEAVRSAVENVIKPIAGVLQMSMVVRAVPLLNVARDDWNAAIDPKVTGTWNLHKALADVKLDFFVLFSSIAASFGSIGQAAYAAGNTFLDAFIQYRHHLGLPASVLNIGAMKGAGYLNENRDVADSLRAQGQYWLEEQDLLASLQWAMLNSQPPLPRSRTKDFISVNQLAIGYRPVKPLADPSNRIPWRRDRRMGAYWNLEASVSGPTSNTGDAIQALLTSIEASPSVLSQKSTLDILSHEIGIRIYQFMDKPGEELDISQSLSALGVDSLVTIEIRNWWRRSVRVEISTLEILSAGTIQALGVMAVEKLATKFPVRNSDTGDTYLVNKAP